MSKDFYKDNAIGKEGENQIIRDIKNKYPDAVIEQAPERKFSSYDIKVKQQDKPDITIEVKKDEKAKETGNLFIETEMSNASGVFEDTGLTVTESNYWVVIVGKKKYWFKTEELRKLVKDYERKQIQVDSGKLARCYLIPIKDLGERYEY